MWRRWQRRWCPKRGWEKAWGPGAYVYVCMTSPGRCWLGFVERLWQCQRRCQERRGTGLLLPQAARWCKCSETFVFLSFRSLELGNLSNYHKVSIKTYQSYSKLISFPSCIVVSWLPYTKYVAVLLHWLATFFDCQEQKADIGKAEDALEAVRKESQQKAQEIMQTLVTTLAVCCVERKMQT